MWIIIKDADLEFAKRLQLQYDQEAKENETPTPEKPMHRSSLHHSNTNSNSNTNYNTTSNSFSSSNTNSSSTSAVSPDSNSNYNTNSNSVLSSNINSSNTNSSIASRKRKRDQLSPISYDDSENDDEITKNTRHRDSIIKRKTFEKYCEYADCYWVRSDIIMWIARDWRTERIQYSEKRNPIKSGKIDMYSSHGSVCNDPPWVLFSRSKHCEKGLIISSTSNASFPSFILDFKNVKTNVTGYRIRHPTWGTYVSGEGYTQHGENGYMVKWVLEGSNDLRNWQVVHTMNNADYLDDDWVNIARVPQCNEYFSKLRLRMTASNSSGNNEMKIKQIRIFGNVRRTVEKTEHIGETKLIDKFPTISTRKCMGDIGNVFKILNESELIQHADLEEYDEKIPDLQVELKDYQKKGVQWMLNMEENGNADGIHGGLLCDEMGLGKTVQMIALMLAQKQRSDTKDRSIIITPLSLIDQWISEIDKIAGAESFKYINYYGGEKKKITKEDFEACDIVFSTTRTFANAIGKIETIYDQFEEVFWTKTTKQQLIFKLPDKFFSRIIVENRMKSRTRIVTHHCQSVHSLNVAVQNGV